MEPDFLDDLAAWWKKRWRWVGRITFLAMLLFCGSCYPMNDWEVGNGYRDSTIRRVKNTGMVYKTWEVEGVDYGARTEGVFTPEKFHYSVADQQVLEQIQAIPPETKVRIYYSERKMPWFPRGDSLYFITRVEVIK